MKEEIRTHPQGQPPIPLRQLWFGVGAGPIIWAIHLVVVYAMVGLHCQWGWFSFTTLGFPGLQLLLVVVTLIAAAGVLWGALLARRNWHEIEQANDRGNGVRERVDERNYFMSYSGFLLSILFLIAIVAAVIPVFVLPPCG
jgi:uncharacterized membrane protein